MSLAPGVQVGRWIVLRRLGAGGAGAVWLARHAELGSLAALKVLHAADPGLAARLRREGRLQATLVHPNVLRVTDLVEHEERPVLVLEYVDGPTLAAYLAARPRLSLAGIDALATGILRGVEAAHRRGWVHRDLKPGNVLLAGSGRHTVPKVADFGISAALTVDEPDFSSGTTTRGGIGTRRYMPLEQLLGHPPDARMDVFALGALLFELCEGRPAFPTVEAWEEALRRGVYPVPTRTDLPERMRAAITSSLCDRRGRVPDAGALLARWSGAVERPPARGLMLPALVVAAAAAVIGWAASRGGSEPPPLPALSDPGRWVFAVNEEGRAPLPLGSSVVWLARERFGPATGRTVEGEPTPLPDPWGDPVHSARLALGLGSARIDPRSATVEDLVGAGSAGVVVVPEGFAPPLFPAGYEPGVLDPANYGVDAGFASALACGDRLFACFEHNDPWKSWWLGLDPGRPLDDPEAWAVIRPADLHPLAVMMGRGACDERHLYLPPYFDGENNHGVALRYDLSRPFDDPGSWEQVDLTQLDPAARGYIAVVLAEGGAYYAPWFGTWGGTVARFDVRRGFADPDAWEFVDLTRQRPAATGFDVAWDGRYVWFVSMERFRGIPGQPGVLARYDTRVDGPWSAPVGSP
jgi:serine/threonine protein kinase